MELRKRSKKISLGKQNKVSVIFVYFNKYRLDWYRLQFDVNVLQRSSCTLFVFCSFRGV